MANDINLTNAIVGSNGDDILSGIPTAQNSLFGYDGNDLLLGADRDDILIGGDGNDILGGGPGSVADWFEFDRYDGRDIVTDFGPEEKVSAGIKPPPLDRILLHDGLPMDIQRVIETATDDPGSGGTVLHYGHTEILLQGVPRGDLSPDWFIVG